MGFFIYLFRIIISHHRHFLKIIWNNAFFISWTLIISITCILNIDFQDCFAWNRWYSKNSGNHVLYKSASRIQVGDSFESLFLLLSLEYRGGGQGWGIKNEQPLGWEQWKRRKKRKPKVLILFYVFSPNLPTKFSRTWFIRLFITWLTTIFSQHCEFCHSFLECYLKFHCWSRVKTADTSGSACKKLRSHHSVLLTSKRLEKMKKSNNS